MLYSCAAYPTKHCFSRCTIARGLAKPCQRNAQRLESIRKEVLDESGIMPRQLVSVKTKEEAMETEGSDSFRLTFRYAFYLTTTGAQKKSFRPSYKFLPTHTKSKENYMDGISEDVHFITESRLEDLRKDHDTELRGLIAKCLRWVQTRGRLSCDTCEDIVVTSILEVFDTLRLLPLDSATVLTRVFGALYRNWKRAIRARQRRLSEELIANKKDRQIMSWNDLHCDALGQSLKILHKKGNSKSEGQQIKSPEELWLKWGNCAEATYGGVIPRLRHPSRAACGGTQRLTSWGRKCKTGMEPEIQFQRRKMRQVYAILTAVQ